MKPAPLFILTLIATFLQFAPVPAMAADEAGPSFDCAAATSGIDRAICADPALAAADATLAKLYSAARTSAFGEGRSNMLASQRQWLRSRNSCRPQQTACLADSYKTRLRELAIAALFVEPKLALETLRHADPAAVPLYEAIWLYASAPPGKEPKARISPLVAPFLETPADPKAHHWGLDMLREDGIDTPAKVLASDANFASFLQHLAPYVDSTAYPMAMPCAAVIRRPALLEATAPLFGSSLDSGVMATDCEAMLPATPRFDALVDALWKNWPDCDGTICHTFYRAFRHNADAARLGQVNKDIRPRRDLPPGATPALVSAATAELAAQYRQYPGLTPSQARERAGHTILEMLASAGIDGTEEAGE